MYATSARIRDITTTSQYGFEGTSAAAKREGAARNAFGPVLGSGTDLCLAEGLP